MLRDFLNWNPIVPASPKALADLLAPLMQRGSPRGAPLPFAHTLSVSLLLKRRG
jgi:hypothetical protein